MKQFLWGMVIVLASIGYSADAAEFSFFSDIRFVTGNEDEKGFALGKVDIVTQPNLSEQTYAIVDILLEVDQNKADTAIKRLSINHSFSEKFEIGAGRYMKPLGLWNYNFAHGSLAQHTVTRPYLVSIEETDKGFLPSHLVGLLLGGETHQWSYQFAVSNSDGIDSSYAVAGTGPSTVATLNSASRSDDFTLLLRTTYRITDFIELGFMASVHNYIETSNNGLVPEGETLFQQNFVSLDFSYFGNAFYTFGEYYYMQGEDNADLSGGGLTANPDTYSSSAYYLQLGYEIIDNLTLVARYESLDYDDNATLYLSQGIVPQTQTVAGINYLLEESHALRFEVSQVEPEVGGSETIYYLQWFFYLL
ncbi:hypothetical protein [Kaarinaea lacus]